MNRDWRSILPAGLSEVYGGHLLRLEGQPNAAGVIALPDNRGRKVSAFVAIEFRTTSSEVVSRLWAALTDIAEDLVSCQGRVTPLIGIPLVGTGYGGLAQRTEASVPKLERVRPTP